MRRLLRILLSAATALSVLIGVAAAVLWPRSYSHEDEIQYDRVSVWEARGEKIVSETQAYLSPRAGGVFASASFRMEAEGSIRLENSAPLASFSAGMLANTAVA